MSPRSDRRDEAVFTASQEEGAVEQALQWSPSAGKVKDAVLIRRAARESFYSAAHPTRSLYVLVAGQVAIVRSTQDGKRLVTDILRAGGVFGDLSLGGATTEGEVADALTDSRALMLDSERANTLFGSDPEFAGRLLAAVGERLTVTCDRFEELAFSPVETRLASSVLRVAGQAGGTAAVTHQFLADSAGAYRETVTRVLGELQLRNILRLDRCSIEIRDPRALAAMTSR